MKSTLYYSTSDADFMRSLSQHASSINSKGGGYITLNEEEYEQARRIAKTADVFKWRWFKLYYAGIQLRKEKK